MNGTGADSRKGSWITSTPFYYGWVILVVAGITHFTSAPGQTYVVSIFLVAPEDAVRTRTHGRLREANVAGNMTTFKMKLQVTNRLIEAVLVSGGTEIAREVPVSHMCIQLHRVEHIAFAEVALGGDPR